MSNIQICPHPLTRDRDHYEVGCGLTVREMLREVKHEWVLDTRPYITLESENHVEVVTDFDTVPAPGELLAVNVIPQGGGSRGGGKSPLGTILSIAVLATASFLGPAVAGALLGPVAAPFGAVTVGGLYGAIGTGVIAIAGNYLVGALTGGPQKPSTSGITQNSQTSSIYTITGTQNALNKYGPIPTMVGGTTRIWPTLAAEPYTEVSGEDQYLRQRFAIIGPVELSEFKIGETLLSEYEDVELEWIQGFAGDTIPTLYADGQDISETAVNITLLQVDDWATRTTQTQTKEIIYDIQQSQLFQVSGSEYIATSVEYEVSYRETGTTGDWLAPNLGEGSTVAVVDGDATRVTISGYYTNSRLFSYRFTVTEGQYDVRWRRITADHEDNTEIFDGMAVSVLRSIANHPGIDADRLPPMAIIDLRIKASGQLNGIVDQLNCLASAYLPVYDGISAVNYELSDNPAWAYFNVLYGLANKNRITDLTRYDLDGLTEWAALCTAQGWAINGILDTSTTTYKMLQTIATIGRSSLSMINNKYGIATDWEKNTVVQVFTPRNSWGFESTKAWPDEIHAIRAQFVDETSGYEQGERTIYVDGYTSANATKFLDQEIQYVTNPDQVWKNYRYQLADRTLRPEVYSFSVDVENLRCTRGDRIRVVHDVMSVGLGQARIKSVTTDGGGNVETATIDSLWTLDTTTSYAFNVQRLNGQVYEGFLTNPIALDEYDTVTFNPAIPAAVAPVGGELIAFGEADNGVGLDAIIHEIVPGSNLTAKLVCQDYAPGIQNAADGVIPAYDAQITVGRNPRLGRPDAPVIESVVSDESVIIIANDGTLITRAVISLEPNNSPVPVSGIVAQYRLEGNTLWESIGTFPQGTSTISVNDLIDGNVYDFRVQAITDIGAASPWVYELGHTIIGKTSPPPDVTTLLLDGDLLRWTYPERPVDFAGFRVRYAIAGSQYSWATAIPVSGNPLVSVNQFDISGFSGSLVWLVKGEDTTGNQSTNPAVAITNLGNVGLINVLETWPESPDWTGTITNGTIVSSELVADAEDTWLGVNANYWWSGNDSFALWGMPTYAEMTYEWSTTFQVGGDLTIQRDISDGSYIEFAAESDRQAWDGVNTTIRWTGINTASWWDGLGDYQPWVGSINIDAGATLYFRAIAPSGSTQGTFTTITPTIDVPDIEETIQDVTISTAGTRLTLTKTFQSIKAIVYGIQDNGLGTTGVRVVDKDETLGPLLQAQTANALIDVRVQGY